MTPLLGATASWRGDSSCGVASGNTLRRRRSLAERLLPLKRSHEPGFSDDLWAACKTLSLACVPLPACPALSLPRGRDIQPRAHAPHHRAPC